VVADEARDMEKPGRFSQMRRPVRWCSKISILEVGLEIAGKPPAKPLFCLASRRGFEPLLVP
jgi:hypothetical protein